MTLQLVARTAVLCCLIWAIGGLETADGVRLVRLRERPAKPVRTRPVPVDDEIIIYEEVEITPPKKLLETLQHAGGIEYYLDEERPIVTDAVPIPPRRPAHRHRHRPRRPGAKPVLLPTYESPKYAGDYAPAYCPTIDSVETQCRPAKDCSVWYDLVSKVSNAACQLEDGSAGLCCPDLPYNGRGKLFKRQKKEVPLYHEIDRYSLNAAARTGHFNLRMMDEVEKALKANNLTVRTGSAEFSHLLFARQKVGAKQRSRDALVAIEATKELAARFQLNSDEAGFGTSKFSLLDTVLKGTCPAEPICNDDSPFRTIDGSCNNLQNPTWGQATSHHQRYLVPLFADGVWKPRVSVKGYPLTSPRVISISVVPDVDAPSDTNTLWVMQYGQFINHDINFTPFFRQSDDGNPGFQCCAENGQFISNRTLLHPQCLPIEIPRDDPFFGRLGRRCMSFVRSTPAPRSDCRFGHGEQMNQNTHFLDHSNVYGSSAGEAKELRTFVGGSLKVTPRRYDLPLLPPNKNATTNCTLSKRVTGIDPPADVRCFEAGDDRAGQHPDLAVNHIIFLRQHNKLAVELSRLNPHWGDERTFQEARRILTAQMQHITYNEWLPIIIGREKMQEMGLLPLAYGFSKDYDETANPSTVNEFSTAAFRFGHSLIQGHIDLVNKARKKDSTILLRQHFNRVQFVYTPGNVDKFLIGLATQPSQGFDNYFTEEVTNHLFEAEGAGFGLDLVSLNIQRGRDHGIQGYNAYRALCGLPRATHFHELLDVIPATILERFKLLYASVDDIDLFIAGVSERPVPGAEVGPTFQCMIADQFLRLKRGDRFFYDLAGQTGSFTAEQLNEIRRSSFARLICDNSHVESHQPLAFKVPSSENPVVDCDSAAIPRMSLQPWKETPANHQAGSHAYDAKSPVQISRQTHYVDDSTYKAQLNHQVAVPHNDH